MIKAPVFSKLRLTESSVKGKYCNRLSLCGLLVLADLWHAVNLWCTRLCLLPSLPKLADRWGSYLLLAFCIVSFITPLGQFPSANHGTSLCWYENSALTCLSLEFFGCFQTQRGLNHCGWPYKQQSESAGWVGVAGLLTRCHDSKNVYETTMATRRWNVCLLQCLEGNMHTLVFLSLWRPYAT